MNLESLQSDVTVLPKSDSGRCAETEVNVSIASFSWGVARENFRKADGCEFMREYLSYFANLH